MQRATPDQIVGLTDPTGLWLKTKTEDLPQDRGQGLCHSLEAPSRTWIVLQLLRSPQKLVGKSHELEGMTRIAQDAAVLHPQRQIIFADEFPEVAFLKPRNTSAHVGMGTDFVLHKAQSHVDGPCVAGGSAKGARAQLDHVGTVAIAAGQGFDGIGGVEGLLVTGETPCQDVLGDLRHPGPCLCFHLGEPKVACGSK